MTEKMGEDAVLQSLQTLSGWDLLEGRLHRRYRFDDFRSAFGFMAAVATAAEAMDHHPEWHNVHRTVEVWLTTHSAGGITEKDLALAREMERLAGASGPG